MLLWDETYETGNIDIDECHKILINVVNLLTATHCSSPRRLSTYVALVKDSVGISFRIEERLMAERCSEHPEVIEEHVKEHELFVERLAIYDEDVANGNLAVVEALSIFVKQWVLRHLLSTDKALGNCLAGDRHYCDIQFPGDLK